MFHFPTFPPHALCVQAWVTGHDSCRVSPFGNPRIKAWSAAPRGLSQPPTSFIGSWCQGIHRAPLLTCSQKRCSRPLCSSQGTGGLRGTSPRASEEGCRSVTTKAGRVLTHPPEEPDGRRLRADYLRSLRTQQRAYGRRRSDHRGSGRRVQGRGTVLTMLMTQPAELVSVPPLSTLHEAFARGRGLDVHYERQMLLRKEVIQPHLPVRLPCYDFVPIANPTFDGSLHKGWATGFGCYRLS
jgi:hypothetical protein